MSFSISRLAFTDCYELLDTAICDAKGIRVKLTDANKAWHFRHRLHHARRIDRQDNAETYPEDHPLHGRSVYDELVVRIEGQWIMIEKVAARTFEIESLGERDVS